MDGIGAEVDALAARLDALPDALRWTVLIVGAVALAVLLTMLVGQILNRTLARGGLPRRVLDAIRRPARLLAVALVLGGIVRASSLPDGWRAVLAPLSLSVAILVAGWLVALALDVVARRTTEGLDPSDEDNLDARRHLTQVRLLRRIVKSLVWVLTAGLALWVFEPVRHVGTSIFASAGVAGIVLGFAARPVFSNIIAGVQIALTQPIRIDDVVIVEGEWGRVEEIGATYVVIRVWDLRRLVVPLSYFIEQPFENWSRESPELLGAVIWHLDWTAPIGAMRAKLDEMARASPHWDGKLAALQVIGTGPHVIEVRAVVSAHNSAAAWALRCDVREAMIAWLQSEHPGALPRRRAEVTRTPSADQPVADDGPLGVV